jgi:hypothetical protein
MSGFVNVDKFGTPDVQCDLEVFPWPWEDSSVDEVVMNHVLEHLGATTENYFGIIKELYRICKPEALIHINVPDPRHDDFLHDPTHVRAITPEGLALFSKAANLKWQAERKANSPLALYLDVDFEIIQSTFRLDSPWDQLSQEQGESFDAQLDHAIRHYNNVVKEIWLVLKVIKPSP